MANVLILGGLGFLGARLTDALFKEGHSITLTSRTLSPQRREWLEKYKERMRWFSFDSRTQDRLVVGERIDCLINLAMPSAAAACQDPKLARQDALRVLDTCFSFLQQGKAGRFIHLSSFHVYGAHHGFFYSEEDETLPTHPYGEIHLECEQRILNFKTQVPFVILRPTNVVGAPAHQDIGVQMKLVFLDLCRQAVIEKRIKLYSNGVAYRDFITMHDILTGMQLLAFASSFAGPYQILNLSHGHAIRFIDLAREICHEAQDFMQQEIILNVGKGQDSYPEPFTVDHRRFQSLGWSIQGSLKSEICQTLHFLSNLN